MLTGLGRDVRIAWRTIRRAPRFSLFVIALLGLGVGGGGSLMMLFETLVLRPVPSPHADRLALIEVVNADGAHRLMGRDTLDALERRQTTFDMLAGYTPGVLLRAEIEGRRVEVAVSPVTGHYFELLGIVPSLGRPLTPGDNARESSDATLPVVVSHHFWEQVLERDAEIIGRGFLLDGKQITVVGVGPSGYKGLSPESSVDITVPIEVFGRISGVNDPRVGVRANFTVGRLKPGVSLAAGRDNLAAVWPAVRDGSAPPVTERELAEFLGQQLETTDFRTGLSLYRDRYAEPLVILLWLAVTLVILMIANLTGLLIARNARRLDQWKVRRALGAGVRHLVRLSLAESAMYVAGGALLAIPVAWWTSHGLIDVLWQGNGPSRFVASAGIWTFAAVGATALLALVVMGLLPAWLVGRAGTLSSGVSRIAPRPPRVIRVLVVVQIAVSVALVFASGLLVRNLSQWWTGQRGYAPDHVALVYLTTQPGADDVAKIAASLGPLIEQVRAHPGVEAASASYIFTRLSISLGGAIEVHDAGTAEPRVSNVRQERLMPGYFETIGAPLVAGRDFSEADAAAGYRVAVITAGLERVLWPDGAVGRRLAIGQTGEILEIIGVVGDMTPIDPRMGETPFVFTPLMQNPGSSRVAVLNVRTARPLEAALLLEMVEAGGQYTILNITSMNERTSRVLASERVTAALGTAFGALALLVAATGLASLLAYLVEGRRREFGVKLALGAEPARLMGSVVGEAAVLFAIGIALGVPLAAGAGRLIGTFVINVGLADPVAVSGSALLLLVVVLAAAALPALRAAHTNPLDALRAD